MKRALGWVFKIAGVGVGVVGFFGWALADCGIVAVGPSGERVEFAEEPRFYIFGIGMVVVGVILFGVGRLLHGEGFFSSD